MLAPFCYPLWTAGTWGQGETTTGPACKTPYTKTPKSDKITFYFKEVLRVGKHIYKKIGPSSERETCVKCGNNPQARNGRGGFIALCQKCKAARQNEEKGIDHWRDGHYKRNYGITLEEYNDAAASQSGLCKICNKPNQWRGSDRLVVDHSHKTGLFRGLLCHHCNSLLGHSFDDPLILSRAIDYLKTPSSQ